MSESEQSFATQSEIERTPTERLRTRLDRSVLTPVKIVWTDWRGRVGAAIILLYLLVGTVGVVLVAQPAYAQGPRSLDLFENLAYPLGTDNLGRSLFGMTVHATPPMLKMIAGGSVFATGLATAVGTFAGYKGGTVERILMTLTDTMMAIPGLPLVIVLGAVFEPRNPFLVGIILSIGAWAGLARTLRSQVLTIREETYVEASYAMGLSTRRIIYTDVLPNLMPYILVNFANSARRVIYSSVALYFLGVLPITSDNWGVMLDRAYQAGALWNTGVLHELLVPLFAIFLLSLGLILFSQGTDRLFNPRIRAKHTTQATETSDEDVNTTGPILQ